MGIFVIYSVATKGRTDLARQWVTSYKLSYSLGVLGDAFSYYVEDDKIKVKSYFLHDSLDRKMTSAL